MSRTFVPESETRSSSPWGHVFGDAMPSQRLHQNECSKFSVWIPSSPGANSLKMSCASYVP